MSKLTTATDAFFGSLTATLLAFLFCPTTYSQSTQVPSAEVREFEILVSGKPAGTSTTKITEIENGLTAERTDAVVNLNYHVYTYRYEFHGREVWKGNRLLSVENRAVDNGKQLVTNARVDAQASVIQTNDKGPVAGPVVSMTTSYWCAPKGQKGDVLQLLDADQGSVHGEQIDGITPDHVLIGGNQVECSHYHLSGDLLIDLWFDAQHRLVRQQTTEEGHPVELRLTRIHTEMAPLTRQ